MKLPFRPAPIQRRHEPDRALPVRFVPLVEPESVESAQSTSSAQDRVLHGRVTKTKAVKSAAEAKTCESSTVSVSMKESGSPWPDTLETENEMFEFLEYHLGVNQEEVQRSVRAARKQPRQSLRRAIRSGGHRGSDDVSGEAMTTTTTATTMTANIAVPIYLHVSFKSLKSNTSVAPTVMMMLQDLPDVAALCARLRNEHSEVIGKQFFDTKQPRKWIFESKAGEEDNDFHGQGQHYSKVCSQIRADKVCRDFFHFLREMRRIKVGKLTQEADAGRDLSKSTRDAASDDRAFSDEHEVSEVPLVEGTAIDGFVEVHF